MQAVVTYFTAKRVLQTGQVMRYGSARFEGKESVYSSRDGARRKTNSFYYAGNCLEELTAIRKSTNIFGVSIEIQKEY
jgi:hypothetical protein